MVELLLLVSKHHDEAGIAGVTWAPKFFPTAALDSYPIINNHTVVDSLNQTFVALSDPTRRAILVRLGRGEATVSQLAEPFGISQQAISKHLAYLERAELIEKRREGRQHFCTLRPEALKEASGWIDQYRQFWDEAFDRLETVLVDMKRRKPREGKDGRRKQ
jgi:DNA-binding transcriptional ArsR family regulator